NMCWCLMEGHGEVRICALVRLAARLIIEEGLEGEPRTRWGGILPAQRRAQAIVMATAGGAWRRRKAWRNTRRRRSLIARCRSALRDRSEEPEALAVAMYARGCPRARHRSDV